MALQTDQETPQPHATFRVDVQLHDLLVNKNSKPKSLLPNPAEPMELPEPEFPSRPDLANLADPEAIPDKRSWTAKTFTVPTGFRISGGREASSGKR